LGVEEAAAAILAVADSHMAGSIRQVSVERGFDPRDFALVAFGGAGPLHVCALMREADVAHGIVPRYPGATSALGCLVAQFRHDLVQTLNLPLAALDPARVSGVLDAQRARGLALLREEGHEGEPLVLHEADMAYQGQVHTVRVALPARALTREEIGRRFDERYREAYGGLLEGYPVLLTNVRTTVVGPRPAPELGAGAPAEAAEAARVRSRQAWFAGKLHECPVYRREAMAAGLQVPGPAIVEQEDTTVLVEPGFEARVDPRGHLLIGRP
jgi:N-methylhydantoinase A